MAVAHLSQLMNNIDALLSSEVYTLLQFPYILPDTLSVPGSHPGPPLCLAVLSPWAPFGCDSFSDFLTFDDLNRFEADWSDILYKVLPF